MTDMRATDFDYTSPDGIPSIELSDVRSLLLDLAMAQTEGGDTGPMRLMAEERIRVAKITAFAEAGCDPDDELLQSLVGAAHALQAAQEAYGRALLSLDLWKEGQGF
jgi:hypothetical protein